MKLLVVSDLHGSLYWGKRVIELFEKEGFDKLIILGDLYYHGPRNPLTDGYDPMELSKLLNAYKDSLLVIRGNCDSEVDEAISEFEFRETGNYDFSGITLTLTHGHIFNSNNLPKNTSKILLHGHFHIAYIDRKRDDKIIVASPGSVSLPKDGIRGYLVIEDGEIELKKFNE